MNKIHEKTLNDLEFATVLQQVSELCTTEMGKEKALAITPFLKEEDMHASLKQTFEYLSSFENNNAIPNHGFDSIANEIKLLKVENTLIEVSGFRKMAAISATVNTHILFYRKFKEYYEELHKAADEIEFTKEIIEATNKIIDRFGEIKDDASEVLSSVRRSIGQVKAKINQSFGSALQQAHSAGYLDDIRESVVENRRVLAVKAMYRRKVKGSLMGSSKTGSIVYIEPEATRQYSRELNNLEFEEKEEINRILKELTNFMRPFTPLLTDYQSFLSLIDTIAAKAKYADKMNAVLPEITEERKLELKEAYHPLLYLTNKEKKEKTYPQDIVLHERESHYRDFRTQCRRKKYYA